MNTIKSTPTKIIATVILLFSINQMYSQKITYNVSTYASGKNISCHGATDGWINVTVVGGTAPITFDWSNSATTEDLSSVGAGTYTLIITDSVNKKDTAVIHLYEPGSLYIGITPSQYNGNYGISKHGGNDGSISTQMYGGSSPFTYLWSNSATTANIDGLTAGSYTVTVTDDNGCTANDNKTLTEPSVLSITGITAANHNGNNISCYRGKDGSINLTVTGGVLNAEGKYYYEWSNGDFFEDPSKLSAGDYSVIVTDANGATAYDSITLTEPNNLKIVLTPSSYIGYNISCNGCTDGTITTNVTGGTSTYTYLWEGSQITANRTALGVGEYSVTVTDANGCTAENLTRLAEPAAGGWTLNSNIADTTNSIGTVNNAPLIFKTNNTERMRIGTTGNVTIDSSVTASVLKVGTPSDNLELKTLHLSGGGSIMSIGGGTVRPIPSCAPAFATGNIQFNRASITNAVNNNMLDFRNDGTNGYIEYGDNAVFIPNPATTLKINSYCSSNVDICYGGGHVTMANNPYSKVFIGMGICSTCTSSTNTLYKLYVEGGIATRDVKVTANTFPDYVFEKNYNLMTIYELDKFLKENKHLPGLLSAKEIEKNEGYEIGDMQTKLVKTVEEQTLYIIDLQKQMDELKKQLAELKNK